MSGQEDDDYRHSGKDIFFLFGTITIVMVLGLIIEANSDYNLFAFDDNRHPPKVRSSSIPYSQSKNSKPTGLSEYQKCRLEYIGRRNLRLDRMSDHELFKMESGIRAQHPFGCGGLSK
jgi:hypothetical protein